MLIRTKYKTDKYTVLGVILVLFFCKKAFASFVARTFGTAAINLSYILVFSALLFIYLLMNNRMDDLFMPLLVYFVVFILFYFTFLVHPEYIDWFTHRDYGVKIAFLNPRCGIWAFLIVWLYKDYARLYQGLKLVAWIAFVYFTLQFAAAMHRGYWANYDVSTGQIAHTMYNLTFGYDMLLPTSFMGASAFLKNKRLYYIPFAVGVLCILLGGSRGAVIWPVAMFPLMLPFKWKNMTAKGRSLYCFLFFLLFVAVVVITVFFEQFTTAIIALVERLGLSSRTITSIFSGSFSDPNGRDQIYSMAIELIKTGGPFGWGVYGDRYVIGNFFVWGYSHNIFLELLVSFGYIGGSIICISLFVGVVRLYKSLETIHQQIIFITFLVTSMKLMLSDSFWYYPAFWALLVLIIKVKKRSQLTEVVWRKASMG